VSALLQHKPQNTIDFILDKPLIFAPGQEFRYNSGEPHLIAASIQNAAQMPLEKWADDVLFSKIGFNNYTWLEYDGYNFGGYGISTTPRELAKIAQLTLNGGKWNEEQIINNKWINEMVSTQSTINSASEYTFGHLWWINESESIYFMSGSGGQYACIIPDKNLIIVAMSEHDTDDGFEIGFETFLELVNKIRVTAN
jgi:CubicO group peptidase (beta-lactamase class C family)